jgi:hypothetical protein
MAPRRMAWKGITVAGSRKGNPVLMQDRCPAKRHLPVFPL